MNNLSIIMCPTLSEYPKPPDDQPGCELFDCPKCKNKMWLSEKKRGSLLFSAVLGKKLIIRCYDCIKVEPDILIDAQVVNI